MLTIEFSNNRMENNLVIRSYLEKLFVPFHTDQRFVLKVLITNQVIDAINTMYLKANIPERYPEGYHIQPLAVVLPSTDNNQLIMNFFIDEGWLENKFIADRMEVQHILSHESWHVQDNINSISQLGYTTMCNKFIFECDYLSSLVHSLIMEYFAERYVIPAYNKNDPREYQELSKWFAFNFRRFYYCAVLLDNETKNIEAYKDLSEKEFSERFNQLIFRYFQSLGYFLAYSPSNTIFLDHLLNRDLFNLSEKLFSHFQHYNTRDYYKQWDILTETIRNSITKILTNFGLKICNNTYERKKFYLTPISKECIHD